MRDMPPYQPEQYDDFVCPGPPKSDPRIPPGKPGDQVPAEPKIIQPRGGVISPNSREAEEKDGNEGWKRRPKKLDGRLGAGFARLSGAEAQRIEEMVAAISKGFRDARQRDARDAALARDPEFLRSLGFIGRSDDNS